MYFCLKICCFFWIIDVGVEASGDYYDTEDDEDSYNEVTPIMPSRIVPTLVSPSFEEPEYGKVLPTSQIAPKKTKTPAFDVIKTALFDDSESEGSGLGYGPDNDFEQTSIIYSKISMNHQSLHLTIPCPC